MNSEEKRKQQLQWLQTHPPTPKDGDDSARKKTPAGLKHTGKKARDSETGNGRSGGSRRPFISWEEPVDEELDFHGFAVDEAMTAVEQALNRYRARPGARLRIIHGQSSGNRDSIKGTLYRLLATVWKRQVRFFRLEPGNAGSTLVILGKPE